MNTMSVVVRVNPGLSAVDVSGGGEKVRVCVGSGVGISVNRGVGVAVGVTVLATVVEAAVGGEVLRAPTSDGVSVAVVLFCCAVTVPTETGAEMLAVRRIIPTSPITRIELTRLSVML